MFRISVLILFMVLWAVPGQAGTRYDMAYYLGLVKTSGGAELADGTWNVSNERGIEDNLQDGPYEDAPENAHIAHNNGDYALLTAYWYESVGNWVLDNTRVFAVGDNYIEYCGAVLHDDGITIIPGQRLRFPRYMEVGDIGAISCPGTIRTPGGDVATNVFMSFFLQKDGITLTAPDVPSTVNNCLRLVLSEGTGLNAGSHVFVLGPARGSLLFSDYEYGPANLTDAAPLGVTDVYIWLKTTQFGTAANFSVTGATTAFTSAGELSAIGTTVDNLAIPSSHVEQAAGGTVVVPMF